MSQELKIDQESLRERNISIKISGERWERLRGIETELSAIREDVGALSWANDWLQEEVRRTQDENRSLRKELEKARESSQDLAVLRMFEGLKSENARLGKAVDARESENAALRAELARETEIFTAEDGEIWTRPTAEAYFRVCRALKHAKECLNNAG